MINQPALLKSGARDGEVGARRGQRRRKRKNCDSGWWRKQAKRQIKQKAKMGQAKKKKNSSSIENQSHEVTAIS